MHCSGLRTSFKSRPDQLVPFFASETTNSRIRNVSIRAVVWLNRQGPEVDAQLGTANSYKKKKHTEKSYKCSIILNRIFILLQLCRVYRFQWQRPCNVSWLYRQIPANF